MIRNSTLWYLLIAHLFSSITHGSDRTKINTWRNLISLDEMNELSLDELSQYQSEIIELNLQVDKEIANLDLQIYPPSAYFAAALSRIGLPTFYSLNIQKAVKRKLTLKRLLSISLIKLQSLKLLSKNRKENIKDFRIELTESYWNHFREALQILKEKIFIHTNTLIRTYWGISEKQLEAQIQIIKNAISLLCQRASGKLKISLEDKSSQWASQYSIHVKDVLTKISYATIGSTEEFAEHALDAQVENDARRFLTRLTSLYAQLSFSCHSFAQLLPHIHDRNEQMKDHLVDDEYSLSQILSAELPAEVYVDRMEELFESKPAR